MKPNPLHRLPAPLEAATQRLKLAARDAVERTVESLGLAALASSNAYHRDGLLGAQFELNRKSAVFVLAFNDSYDQRIIRELGRDGGPSPAAGQPSTPGSVNPAAAPLADAAPAPPTDWASLSLVEDKEVEAQITAERFGMEISHACEWELRELDGYVATLLDDAGGARDRNPLRPELLGHALMRGIDTVSDRADVRKVLSSELSRSLSSLLRSTYADILSELRGSGVQPMRLAVRQRAAAAAATPESAAAEQAAQRDAAAQAREPRGDGSSVSGAGGSGSRSGATSARMGSGLAGSASGSHSHSGTLIGQVDPALMSLIRQLTRSEVIGDPSGFDAAAVMAASRQGRPSHPGHPGTTEVGATGDSLPMPPNVILAHREALRRASNTAVDHMVIDVIGFMFDQILADPKVPPQMARQIARLQLPVLRAALGDPSFFSSRRHPVRRFVNRIASLGAAFEDFEEVTAKSLLAKVRALVQEVVEGEFDQIEIYDHKLAALEAFTAEQAKSGTSASADVANLLSEKEDQQRLRQLYAQRLAGDLKNVVAPPFMRDFLSGVWSQVLLRAAEKDGPNNPNGPLTQRLRGVGSELFLSVLPKATPAHRKTFLAELPKLMQDLTEGMNLIGWPEDNRRAFFGQLMPAHAEALKSPGGRQLEINLMARQVEGALQRPPPQRAELPPVSAAAAAAPLAEDAAAPSLTAEEAQRVGLVQETAVDWSGPPPVSAMDVDIDITAPAHTVGSGAEPIDVGLGFSAAQQGRAEGQDPNEVTEGRALADHVQIGIAYQMYLDGEWQKVRLSHVSAARTFFIFSHGGKHKKTVSLTQRMLIKLCDSGRLKAFEPVHLIERATARARRQLAALSSGA
jgi:Protein of unknown function (DUF1631)